MTAALRLEGVRAGYGPVEVLHGIDLTVAPGTVVALVGPNGAGKTTLLRAAAGLLPLRAGRVLVRGTGVDGRAAARRSRAGLCLLPQGRAIFPKLSVTENIAMFVRGKGVDAAMEQATAAFPVLGARRAQRAGTLSGGEQQMLAVARALVTNPSVVLADELSLGLAPAIVDQILERVVALRDAGTALLLVEQYVGRALAIADYVYVLQKGAIALVEEAGRCDEAALVDRYLGGAA